MKKVFTAFIVIIMFAALSIGIIAAAAGDDASTLPVIGQLFERTASVSDGTPASYNIPGGLPSIDLSDWRMKLVNADNPISADFNVTTGVTGDGYLFDERAIFALDELLQAGRAEGMQLVLTSAYRTYNYQDMLFQDKVTRVIAEYNVSREQAEEIAATEVARPGTSEHNLGLAADIVCEYYGILDEGYADTPEAKWLRENCAEYGFILRYDEDKEDITGIIYEPWHFRYVGKEAAQYIMESGLCLEEFLALYE